MKGFTHIKTRKIILVNARSSLHVRSAVAAPTRTFQPTYLSSASIESLGLLRLHYGGNSLNPKNGKQFAVAQPLALSDCYKHRLSHSLSHSSTPAPAATCEEAEISDSALALPRSSLEALFHRVRTQVHFSCCALRMARHVRHKCCANCFNAATEV
jgi:hypothetical protein